MRIAAKRLRYTMEICGDLYKGSLDEPIKKVRKLQTLLGKIHDCDVWVQDIQAFLIDERNRTQEYFGYTRPMARLIPGIEHIRLERQDRHKELFAELNDYWQQLQEQSFWQTLNNTTLSPTKRQEH